MGPDSAEYTEGQQGSTLTFLFTQSTALCVRTMIDQRPVQTGSLPFAQCMLGNAQQDEWVRKAARLHSAFLYSLYNILTQTGTLTIDKMFRFVHFFFLL